MIIRMIGSAVITITGEVLTSGQGIKWLLM
jgi:hypothetical protein